MEPDGDLLPEGTLVIADLHLDPAADARIESFCAWLDASESLPRLVILGDLFDVWVGPAQARLPGAAEVLETLSRRVAQGTRIDLIPGNRDFMMDADFERRSGARLHEGGLVARLPRGAGVLFLHGDELCTRDVQYQRMKRVLRSGPVRALARRLPLASARWAAGRLRRATARSLAAKPAQEKRMQAQAADQQARRFGAAFVVCGHAHQFRDEHLPGGARWIVLDAWGGERDLLAVGPGGELQALASAVPGGLPGTSCP